MTIPYIELKARSAFSFGDGAISPEVLAERGAQLGYSALGLVDSTDLGGIIRFAMTADRCGVKPIIGAELRVEGHPIGLLVRNEQGYRNLAHLVTRGRLQNGRGLPGLSLAEVAQRSDGLHLLTGPPSGDI